MNKDMINSDAATVVDGASARRWSRRYTYGYLRATGHPVLAYFFANRQSRRFLRDLWRVHRQMKREGDPPEPLP